MSPVMMPPGRPSPPPSHGVPQNAAAPCRPDLSTLPLPALAVVCAELELQEVARLRAVSRSLRDVLDASPAALMGPTHAACARAHRARTAQDARSRAADAYLAHALEHEMPSLFYLSRHEPELTPAPMHAWLTRFPIAHSVRGEPLWPVLALPRRASEHESFPQLRSPETVVGMFRLEALQRLGGTARDLHAALSRAVQREQLRKASLAQRRLEDWNLDGHSLRALQRFVWQLPLGSARPGQLGCLGELPFDAAGRAVPWAGSSLVSAIELSHPIMLAQRQGTCAMVLSLIFEQARGPALEAGAAPHEAALAPAGRRARRHVALQIRCAGGATAAPDPSAWRVRFVYPMAPRDQRRIAIGASDRLDDDLKRQLRLLLAPYPHERSALWRHLGGGGPQLRFSALRRGSSSDAVYTPGLQRPDSLDPIVDQLLRGEPLTTLARAAGADAADQEQLARRAGLQIPPGDAPLALGWHARLATRAELAALCQARR